MRVAVSVLGDRVPLRFDETTSFGLYEAEGSEILRSLTVPALGQGAEALVSALRDYRANILICGGIDGKTRVALEEAGILVVAGVLASPDQAVSALLSGTLSSQGGCDQESCASCAGCSSCTSCQSKK